MDVAYSVTVSGSYAYVAGWLNSDNLAIFDISDPTTPVLVGNWDPNDGNVMTLPHTPSPSPAPMHTWREEQEVLEYDLELSLTSVPHHTRTCRLGPNDTNVMDDAESVTVSGSYAYVRDQERQPRHR